MVSEAGIAEEAEQVPAFAILAVIAVATEAGSIGGLEGVVVCEDLAGLRMDLPGVAVCGIVCGGARGTGWSLK